MSDLSHTAFPPGGWQFTQPQTGWSNPFPLSTTFDGTVLKIEEMRRKNPAICLRHRLPFDRPSIAKELENYTRRRLGMPLPTPPAPTMLVTGFSSPIVGDVSAVKKLASGSGLLMEWDASGAGTVAQEEANARAKVCSECPLNNVANYEHWQKIPAATAIKSRIARLNGLKLSTPYDQKLGLCDGTYCPTAYLVHAPKVILDKRVGAKIRPGLNANCWILKA